MNWYFKLKRYFKDKNVRHTINKVLEGYDFDYSYLLDIELSKMKAMYDYFSKYGMSESNDRTLQTLKRAITVLELYLNDDEKFMLFNSNNLYMKLKDLIIS